MFAEITDETLAYPPEFESDTDALSYMQSLRTNQNTSWWRLAWAITRYAPADRDYGESKLKTAAHALGIPKATATKMRWMGNVWTLPVVKQFTDLKYTHFEPATAVMAKALMDNNRTKTEAILAVLEEANEGEEDENGELVSKSVEWVKSAVRVLEGKQDVAAVEKASFNGILGHEQIEDEDGKTRFFVVIEYESEEAWEGVGANLNAKGLLGEHVSVFVKQDEAE